MLDSLHDPISAAGGVWGHTLENDTDKPPAIRPDKIS